MTWYNPQLLVAPSSFWLLPYTWGMLNPQPLPPREIGDVVLIGIF